MGYPAFTTSCVAPRVITNSHDVYLLSLFFKVDFMSKLGFLSSRLGLTSSLIYNFYTDLFNLAIEDFSQAAKELHTRIDDVDISE